MTTLCSIVSHNQNALVGHLLADLDNAGPQSDFCVLVTQNTLDYQPPLKLPPALMEQGRYFEHQNMKPKGFGANHNAAFLRAEKLFPAHRFDRFCVLNPDIRMDPAVFAQLGEALADQPGRGVVAPNIVSVTGQSEDFARFRPSFFRLVRKLLLGDKGRFPTPMHGPYEPDWFAGMFMLFDVPCFSRIQGFDESYFMYYEDVEICIRARRFGYRPTVLPDYQVVHLAQRSSHRDLRLAFHHLVSMLRFLIIGSRGRGSLNIRL